MELAEKALSINILIVIDTEYIKKNYPNPSKDQTHPTAINHSSQFMICTGSLGVISGQATADLNFKAGVGEYVAFAGTSIYDNSDDAVIVYRIKYRSGAKAFRRFTPNTITRSEAVMPDSNTDNGLPALHVSMNFNSLASRVKAFGTEDFYIYFALYTLADDGQSQNLHGYYAWDPTITVSRLMD